MPNISASDYTAFVKAQAASLAYRNGAIPKTVQTGAQPYATQSVLNAQLLASQASYLGTPLGSLTSPVRTTISEASSTTVTAAASRTITAVTTRPVTNAVSTGPSTNTVTYTTKVPHGLNAGDSVAVTGFTTLSLSGQVLAAGLTSTQFVITNSIAAATETSSAGRITNRVYYTTSVPHGLVASQSVVIANTVATFNLSGSVGGVTSSTQFYIGSGVADTADFAGSGATAGRVSSGIGLVFYTTSVPHGLVVGQTVSIIGAGGTFSVGPVVVASTPTSLTFSLTSAADSASAYAGTSGSIVGNVYYTTANAHGLIANDLNTTYEIAGLSSDTFNLRGFTIPIITDATHFVVANLAVGTAVTGASAYFAQTVVLISRTVIRGNARVMPYNGKGPVNNPKSLSTVHNSTSTVQSSGKFQQVGGLPLTAAKWDGVYSPVPHLARVDTKATGGYKSVRQPV